MTLWTPGGEKKIDKNPTAETPATGQEQVSEEQPELTPEQQQQAAEMAKQLTEAREQILQAKVSDVLANHAMGMYELAAIHLTTEEPNLDEAKLAIDALGILVEGLEGKLGEPEATLKEGLHQLKMGYVQRNTEIEAEEKSAE